MQLQGRTVPQKHSFSISTTKLQIFWSLWPKHGSASLAPKEGDLKCFACTSLPPYNQLHVLDLEKKKNTKNISITSPVSIFNCRSPNRFDFGTTYHLSLPCAQEPQLPRSRPIQQHSALPLTHLWITKMLLSNSRQEFHKGVIKELRFDQSFKVSIAFNGYKCPTLYMKNSASLPQPNL